MAWVTKDSTETYNQTPEPPREYTKKEKAANWWHYHWMAVVVAVLVVVFGVWIIKDTVFQTRPDVQVAYVGTSDLPTDTVTALQDALTPFCSDLNGDGKQDDEDLYPISVMNNLSVDCDCSAHPEAPQMGDIGMLASLDPVALDQACVDLVYASPDPGKVHLIERMESRHGIHTLEHAEAIGIGSRQYELVDLDK